MQTDSHPGSTGTRARANSAIDKSFHFLCIKVNKWRGRYQRILHLSAASLSTLDPSSGKSTNSWRWSQVTKCIATPDNVEEIVISFGNAEPALRILVAPRTRPYLLDAFYTLAHAAFGAQKFLNSKHLTTASHDFQSTTHGPNGAQACTFRVYTTHFEIETNDRRIPEVISFRNIAAVWYVVGGGANNLNSSSSSSSSTTPTLPRSSSPLSNPPLPPSSSSLPSSPPLRPSPLLPPSSPSPTSPPSPPSPTSPTSPTTPPPSTERSRGGIYLIASAGGIGHGRWYSLKEGLGLANTLREGVRRLGARGNKSPLLDSTGNGTQLAEVQLAHGLLFPDIQTFDDGGDNNTNDSVER
jgi:hypothetical protein